MSEQARKIEHEAIPQLAESLCYNNRGLSSEAHVYKDDEAI
jgi:hypothetical protein